MSAIGLLLFIALATQKLTDMVKAYIPDSIETKYPIPRFTALFISLLLTFTTNADVFDVLNVNSKLPYLGLVITGLVCSMGASYLNDFLGLVNSKGIPSPTILAESLAPLEPPKVVNNHITVTTPAGVTLESVAEAVASVVSTDERGIA